MLVQSDWLNSALSPVVYGDIALSINTQYSTILGILVPVCFEASKTVIPPCHIL